MEQNHESPDDLCVCGDARRFHGRKARDGYSPKCNAWACACPEFRPVPVVVPPSGA